MTFDIRDCSIGKQVIYPDRYCSDHLFAIPRVWSREKTFADDRQPIPEFRGVDYWTNHEMTFIDADLRRRRSGVLQVVVPAQSPFLIESKSFKLYFFSFANEVLTVADLIDRVSEDISKRTQGDVQAAFFDYGGGNLVPKADESAVQLDGRVDCDAYLLDPELLTKPSEGEPQWFRYAFDHFRARCLVSGHPDWARVELSWYGRGIDPDALYRYLVSFRQHQGIHEQCVERIFFDLNRVLEPAELKVVGRFTRRGGLDITPVREL